MKILVVVCGSTNNATANGSEHLQHFGCRGSMSTQSRQRRKSYHIERERGVKQNDLG